MELPPKRLQAVKMASESTESSGIPVETIAFLKVEFAVQLTTVRAEFASQQETYVY